jgi:hypothetical protein
MGAYVEGLDEPEVQQRVYPPPPPGTAAEDWPDTPITWKEYASDSGRSVASTGEAVTGARERRWRLEMEDLNAAAEPSPRLWSILRGRSTTWRARSGSADMMNSSQAKLAFKVHCGKIRTLQKAFNEFGEGLADEEKKRIVVGYGDGKFPSHGPRGELAVPVKRTRRVCGHTWPTVDANEAFSTVTCNDCEGRLLSVRTDIPYYDRLGRIRYKENRGCKHCKSDTCKSRFPFKGRDKTGALNIGRITDCMLQGQHRPRCYTRAYHDQIRPRRARRRRPVN